MDNTMIPEEQSCRKLLAIDKRFIESTLITLANTLFEFLDELEIQKKFEIINNYASADKKNRATTFLRAAEELLKALNAESEAIELYCAENSIALPARRSGKDEISECCAYGQGKLILELLSHSLNMLRLLMSAPITQKEILELLQKHFDPDIIEKSLKAFSDPDPLIRAIFMDSWHLTNNSNEGLQLAYLDISKWVSEQKIIHDSLTQLLQELHEHIIDGSLEKFLFGKGILVNIISELLHSEFKSEHHRAFVEKYAYLDGKGQISSLRINRLINKWYAELDDFERNSPTAFWYGWEQLKKFHGVRQAFSRVSSWMLEEGLLQEESQLCYDLERIEGIAKGEQAEYADNLRVYQQKVSLFIQEPPLSISDQDQNIHEKILPHSFTEEVLENSVTPSLDSCPINKSKEPNKTFKPSKPVIVKKLLEEKKVLLSRESRDEKDGIRLRLFKKEKSSEHTNQIKVYFEIIKGPIPKYKLMQNLGLDDREIERAYRSINTIVKDNWHISEYLMYDKDTGKYYINPSYPTTLEN